MARPRGGDWLDEMRNLAWVGVSVLAGLLTDAEMSEIRPWPARRQPIRRKSTTVLDPAVQVFEMRYSHVGCRDSLCASAL
jgi:hypothetical protein